MSWHTIGEGEYVCGTSYKFCILAYSNKKLEVRAKERERGCRDIKKEGRKTERGREREVKREREREGEMERERT